MWCRNRVERLYSDEHSADSAEGTVVVVTVSYRGLPIHIFLKQKRYVTLRRQRKFCCFFFVVDVSSCFYRPSLVFTGTSRAESLPFRDAHPRFFAESWYSSIPPTYFRQRNGKIFNKSCRKLPSKLKTFADSSRKMDFRSQLSARRHGPFTAFFGESW